MGRRVSNRWVKQSLRVARSGQTPEHSGAGSREAPLQPVSRTYEGSGRSNTSLIWVLVDYNTHSGSWVQEEPEKPSSCSGFLSLLLIVILMLMLPIGCPCVGRRDLCLQRWRSVGGETGPAEAMRCRAEPSLALWTSQLGRGRGSLGWANRGEALSRSAALGRPLHPDWSCWAATRTNWTRRADCWIWQQSSKIDD